MAFNDRLFYNYLDTGTTVMTGIVKATTTGGPTIQMSDVKVDTLSALMTLVANTNTLTLEAFWEVSNDGVTFVEVPAYNNAAWVVWVTGTGAPVSKTALLAAPSSIYGWRYARASVRNQVANGLIADTYRIGYCGQKDDFVP